MFSVSNLHQIFPVYNLSFENHSQMQYQNKSVLQNSFWEKIRINTFFSLQQQEEKAEKYTILAQLLHSNSITLRKIKVFAQEAQQQEAEIIHEPEEVSKIETTDEELEGFQIVKAILRRKVDQILSQLIIVENQ